MTTLPDQPVARPQASSTPSVAPTSTSQTGSGRRRPAALSLVDESEVEPANDRLKLGQVIDGKYRIDEVIGRGGMGVVLRARHLVLDEPVVIKVLRPSLMNKEGMVGRFTREAMATSKIKSQHVVRVMDIDALASGVPYIVMEWLEGTDLAAVLNEQGRLPIEAAVSHILDACDAIGEAHELGIIHRDLKPANLFLAQGRDGKLAIKVLDFGISKIEGLTVAEEDSTKPGTMMGSPKFMAPEQMLSMRDVDARADIWALGAILYTLLTGVAPFVAANLPQVCALVLNAEPDPPTLHRPEIPAELEAIVMRCLRKEREYRFATVAELSAALEPFGPEPEPASRRAIDVMRSVPDDVAERITPTPPPASTQHTSITSTMDTAVSAKKPRSSRRVFGWLTLALALGAGGVVFAPKLMPMITSALSPKRSTAPTIPASPPVITAAIPAAIEAPLYTASTAAPVEPPLASASAAAELSPPATSSALSPDAKKPWASPGKGTKPVVKRDPFGGSRN